LPVDVAGLSDAIGIAAGQGHTCAIRRDGAVTCWGYNEYGQLGDGSQVERTMPVKVSGLAHASIISAGASHSCALVGEGQIICWGDASAGQLGDGISGVIARPQAVQGFGNLVFATGFDGTY
jgi:alpha-tubulin suppressor-like RCC1 family protein